MDKNVINKGIKSEDDTDAEKISYQQGTDSRT